MKARDHNVMIVSQSMHVMPLSAMAQALHHACFEAETEGMQPTDDLAVMLLALMFSFRCNVDTTEFSKYPEYMQRCQERMHEVPVLQ